MTDVFREAARQLITSVALITTVGRHGRNGMSAEWTFQISYNPMRLIVLVFPKDATHDNILDSKEFGANFLSDDQVLLGNLGGAYTGKEVDKLSSSNFQTFPAKKIRPLMVAGCFLNAECRLSQKIESGDHTMFIGDVVEVRYDQTKKPLLYSQRKYWKVGDSIEKNQSLYLTCTVRKNVLRVDGRLLGIDRLPQTISLCIRRKVDDKEVFSGDVATDEYGYFEYVRNDENEKSKGIYGARAAWGEFEALATTIAE